MDFASFDAADRRDGRVVPDLHRGAAAWTTQTPLPEGQVRGPSIATATMPTAGTAGTAGDRLGTMTWALDEDAPARVRVVTDGANRYVADDSYEAGNGNHVAQTWQEWNSSVFGLLLRPFNGTEEQDGLVIPLSAPESERKFVVAFSATQRVQFSITELSTSRGFKWEFLSDGTTIPASCRVEIHAAVVRGPKGDTGAAAALPDLEAANIPSAVDLVVPASGGTTTKLSDPVWGSWTNLWTRTFAAAGTFYVEADLEANSNVDPGDEPLWIEYRWQHTPSGMAAINFGSETQYLAAVDKESGDAHAVKATAVQVGAGAELKLQARVRTVYGVGTVALISGGTGQPRIEYAASALNRVRVQELRGAAGGAGGVGGQSGGTAFRPIIQRALWRRAAVQPAVSGLAAAAFDGVSGHTGFTTVPAGWHELPQHAGGSLALWKASAYWTWNGSAYAASAWGVEEATAFNVEYSDSLAGTLPYTVPRAASVAYRRRDPVTMNWGAWLPLYNAQVRWTELGRFDLYRSNANTPSVVTPSAHVDLDAVRLMRLDVQMHDGSNTQIWQAHVIFTPVQRAMNHDQGTTVDRLGTFKIHFNQDGWNAWQIGTRGVSTYVDGETANLDFRMNCLRPLGSTAGQVISRIAFYNFGGRYQRGNVIVSVM